MLKNRTSLLSILILLLLNVQAIAQKKAAEQPDVDAIVDSLLYGKEIGFANDSSVAGAAIGVYWQGKTSYYTYGWADREHHVKTDANTQFEIGSNTKVFTGLMLSSMMADKKVNGNDFIEKYEVVNKKIHGKVRLTDLANHRSGLPTFHDSASLAELIARDTTKDPLMLVTDDYMLSVLKKVDTLHGYGDYEYSNFAVGILGHLLQKKEGKTYDQLLQSMICKPMGLAHTTARADTTSSKLARGYYRKQRAPFIRLCPAMQGAGAIKSDIGDMMTFVKFQMNGDKHLQRALDISHQPYYKSEDLQIAMGWHIGKQYGAEVFEMRGDTYGASSTMLFSKEKGLGIVILLNSANSGAVGRTSDALAGPFARHHLQPG